MARRDDLDRHERADRGRQAQQEQQQEQEQEGVEQQQPEHARLQDQLGNAAIAAMLGSGGAGLSGTGLEVEPARRRRAPEKPTPELGGDDDPVDVDGPLTFDEALAGVNTRASKGDDRPTFVDPMPDDVLPPEDPAFLDEVAGVRDAPRPPPTALLDALVQPSVDAIRLGLRDWAAGAGPFAPASDVWALALDVALRSPPLLQDPDGRVGLARSRVGAIAVAALMAGPALSGPATPGDAAFVDLVLEIRARAHRMRTVAAFTAQEDPNGLPLARDVFLAHCPPAAGDSVPREPSENGGALLEGALFDLLDLPDPAELVPPMREADAQEEDDDPLGLDAVIAEHTGEVPDARQALFDLAVQSAERLAMAAATTRVRLAGAAVVVAEAATDWSVGAPIDRLEALVAKVDTDVADTLGLLVDVARAAQRRTVDRDGLHNGLRRAARGLRRIQRNTAEELGRIAAGVLPPGEGLPECEPHTLPDEVAEAWAVGAPARAMSWARAQVGADRRAATWLVRVAAGDVDGLADDARALADELGRDDPLLGVAFTVFAGAALLAEGRLDEAIVAGDAVFATGLRRRNGTLIADGALTRIEAARRMGRVAEAEAWRRAAGAVLWRLGARGSLSLLARWAPPPEEDA
jgi:hypothetical protein